MGEKNTQTSKTLKQIIQKRGNKNKRIEMDEKMQNGANIEKGKGNCRIAKESGKNSNKENQQEAQI